MTGPQRFLLVGGVALIAIGFGLRRYEARQPRAVTVDSEPIAMEPSVARGPVYEYQVSKPALLKSNGPYPRYPQMLESSRMGGSVLVQFVVGTDGRAEMATFKVLKSTDDRFSDAVKEVIPAMRFSPAEKDGRTVRQYVQMPFRFEVHH